MHPVRLFSKAASALLLAATMTSSLGAFARTSDEFNGLCYDMGPGEPPDWMVTWDDYGKELTGNESKRPKSAEAKALAAVLAEPPKLTTPADGSGGRSLSVIEALDVPYQGKKEICAEERRTVGRLLYCLLRHEAYFMSRVSAERQSLLAEHKSKPENEEEFAYLAVRLSLLTLQKHHSLPQNKICVGRSRKALEDETRGPAWLESARHDS